MAFLPDCDVKRGSTRCMLVSLAAVLLWALAATAGPAAAQTGQTAPAQATHPAAASPGPVAHRHARHKRAKAKEPVVVAPAAPPPPPPPLPPVQQPAHPATVDFRRDTLRIDANNASLVEILHEVSRKTGIVVDGLGHDERVYGQYGPGSISDTLSQLLDGAGYNYVIIGGGAGKPPAKLMLTMAGSTAAITPAPPAPAVSGFGGPVEPPAAEDPSAATQPKTPQEIFDELRAARAARHRPPPR